MVSFREAGRMLDEEIEALPEEIFRGLNGGVNFLPGIKKDSDGLLVLGLYHHNAMGRYVELYYGSFCAVYEDADEEAFRKALRKTLHHELTHHLEGLAGDRSLEKWDDRHRAELIARSGGGPTDSPLFAGGYMGPGGNSVLRRRRPPSGGYTGRMTERWRAVIADAIPVQLSDICTLEKICFSSPWTEEQLAAQLDPSRYVFLTAYDGPKLVGYGAFQYVLDEGYISNIAVAPAYRQRGVGGAVLDALLKRAEKLSLSFLTLEVRASNEIAQRLYRSRNFREVGRRRAYYSHPTEDAVLMTAFLSGETE